MNLSHKFRDEVNTLIAILTKKNLLASLVSSSVLDLYVNNNASNMITVTDNAVKQLQRLLNKENGGSTRRGLRILVARGGCAGMEYQMKVDSPATGDAIIQSDGSEIYIDSESQRYLQGCRVDYHDSLSDSGFKIDNPNASRSCGCGTSFEPKQNDNAG